MTRTYDLLMTVNHGRAARVARRRPCFTRKQVYAPGFVSKIRHYLHKIRIFCALHANSNREIRNRVRDSKIACTRLKIARAMWNFGVEILARAKFWLSPGIEFWLLIFRRLPVFFKENTLAENHPADPTREYQSSADKGVG